MANAFAAADNVLRQGVESISSLVNVPSFINLDFADVRNIMRDAGYAHMGVGEAKGGNMAEDAAMAAITSPLLETSIAGARGVIINISASPDVALDDVEIAATKITSSAHPDANIIWGAAFDESLTDSMRITVIATGFDTIPPGSSGTPATQNYAGMPVAFAADGSGEGTPVKSDDDYFDDILSLLNNREN